MNGLCLTPAGRKKGYRNRTVSGNEAGEKPASGLVIDIQYECIVTHDTVYLYKDNLFGYNPNIQSGF